MDVNMLRVEEAYSSLRLHLEKWPPSLVKDLVGVSPHTSAPEHLPLILEEVKDWLGSHRDDG